MANRQKLLADAMDRMRDDPQLFRKHLLVDVSGRPRQFDDVVTSWQNRDFLAIDESCRRAIGLTPRGKTYSLAWLGRSRGASKTTDAAVIVLYLLFAAKSEVTGVCAAPTKQQAGLLIRSIRRLLRLNEYLRHFIEVLSNVVRHKETGSEIEVVGADESTSMGINPDFIVLDEFTSFGVAGEASWHSLYSASGKRSNSLLLLLTNAGVLGSYQHQIYSAIAADPDCYLSETTEHETLLSDRQLSAQRRILPPSVYARLFENQWVPSVSDAIDPEALQRCVQSYTYPIKPDDISNRGLIFVGGADLSALERKGDAAGVTVLAVDPVAGKIKVAWSKRFHRASGVVDLPDVVATIRRLQDEYKPLSWHMDGYESRRLRHEMIRCGIRCVIENFAGAAAATMASTLLSVVNAGTLELPEGEPNLLREMRSLAITEKNGLLRVIAARSARTGHCDQAFSLLACLRTAQELTARRATFGEPMMARGKSERMNGKGGVFLSGSNDFFRGNSPWQPINL